VGDLASSQAPLTTLASDTGGQAHINSFGFDEAIARAKRLRATTASHGSPTSRSTG
jgi:hypothetical protein